MYFEKYLRVCELKHLVVVLHTSNIFSIMNQLLKVIKESMLLREKLRRFRVILWDNRQIKFSYIQKINELDSQLQELEQEIKDVMDDLNLNQEDKNNF